MVIRHKQLIAKYDKAYHMPESHQDVPCRHWSYLYGKPDPEDQRVTSLTGCETAEDKKNKHLLPGSVL